MQQNKAILMGVLVLACLIVAFFGYRVLVPAQVPAPDTQVGGTPHEARDWFVNGISSGPAAVAESWAVKSILAGQDEAVLLTNNTSADVFVDYAEIQLIANAAGTQTASSTYNVRLFATSTATIPASHDFTAVTSDKYSLIVGTWATSTTATTTNSVGTVPLGGQGSIRLPANWSLVAYINRTGGATCSGVSCETATSSKRGFDIKARAHYHFDDTTVR